MMRIAVMILLLLPCWRVGSRAQETKPLTVSDLPNLEVRQVERIRQDSLKLGNLPIPEMRLISPPEIPRFNIGEFPGVQHARVVAPEVSEFIGPQLPRVELLAIAESNDFKAGLNLSSYKTKVAPNQAISLTNALWNEQGEMYKRPGFDTLCSTPEEFNFLYRYYQQDGDKYLMGGSDTALYFWQEDSTGWTWLVGTEGTSGRWDGCTFEDMFVGTHEGMRPVVWDGEGFIEIGVTADSFLMVYVTTNYGDSSGCSHVDSLKVDFDPLQSGWVTNEWQEYVLGYWVEQYTYTGTTETAFIKDIISYNDASSIYLYGYAGVRRPWFDFATGSPYHYAKIYSLFGIDSVWREGQLDSVGRCQFVSSPSAHGARMVDKDFVWDSTFQYQDYIFEAVGGLGQGKKFFLCNYNIDIDCDNSGWDTSGNSFIVHSYHADCFDTTTRYRIYAPIFLGAGAKFVENYDGHLWLGWTGRAAEQNKNKVIYNEGTDLGNWPPENEIWIESDDGDYITGMYQFYPDQQGHRDEPWAELVVSKEQSLYRIYPTTFAGALDYNTMFISRGVGCCSNSAMAMADGSMLLFPDQHGVWMYNGTKPECISLAIDPIFEEMSLANTEDMSAVYNPQDRHYYLSYGGFYNLDFPSFITAWQMDSAGVKDGYYTHLTEADGDEVGNDEWNFWYTAGNYIDIATKADGEYAIMYKRSSGATGYKIFLALFDADGQQIGDTVRIDDGGNVGYADPADHKFDMNSSGQILACWTDTENGNDDVRCVLTQFDSTDGAKTSNFYANDDSSTNTEDNASWGVAINEAGIGIITWQDLRENVTYLSEIYAQRVQYPATKLGANFKINQNDGTYLDNKPAVGIGDSTFVVAWIHGMAGGTTLHKRAFNIDGTAREGEQTIDSCAGGNVQEPSVAMNEKGRYVIAYDWECTQNSYSIYMQAYDSSDVVHFTATQVTDHDSLAQGPDVAMNNVDVFTIVWYEGYYDADVEIAYRSYNWGGPLMSSQAILSSSGHCDYPEIDCFLAPIDTGTYCLAWNIDYHGWSVESIKPSAFCYQHAISDTTKILFADEDNRRICAYGELADDLNDPVIMTYQSPYMSFTEYPYWENFLRYMTLEAYLDTGTIYLDFYTDYSTLVHQDSIMCGLDCRQEIQLPDSVYGKNLSLKVRTGSTIDEFYLSRYWLEYNVKKERD